MHQNIYHLPPIIKQHARHQLRLLCMMKSAFLTYKVPLSAGYIKDTHFMAQKTWQTANYQAAKAQ